MSTKKILIWIGIIFIVIILLGVIKNARNDSLLIIEYGLGNYDFSLQHDGLPRKYIVHVPKSYDKNTQTPVILAFHGGGGNADESPDYFKLNPISNKEGFIVVYPEGTGNSFAGKKYGTWDAGRCCGDEDDVGFVRKMLEKLEEDFNIDDKRIFATGHSNGGRMNFRLACELSDKIAAIAPTGSAGTFDDCFDGVKKASRNVPILFTDGTEDPCTPYEGGECGTCFNDFLNSLGIQLESNPYMCDSVEDHVEKWKKLYNCSDKSKVTYEQGNTTCITYDCDKSEFVYCLIEGGGHTWPGSKEYSPETCKNNPNGFVCNQWKKAVGPLNPDFNLNDMMWEFFERHPMN